MGFGILRASKLKTTQNIAASLAHNYRDRETPNSDKQLTPQNTHSKESAAQVIEAINERLPAKHRKDAVLCIEYMVTMSPESAKEMTREQQDAYFKDAQAWLEKRHGKENIAGISIHRDETTPHLVCYAVPLVNGKLSAKTFLGGREKLREMQTDFAQSVAAEHGLERGIEGSKAQHQRVQRFYGQLETPIQEVSIHPDNFDRQVVESGLIFNKKESKEQAAARLSKAVAKAYEPMLQASLTSRGDRERIKQLEKTGKQQEKQLEKVKPVLELEKADPGFFHNLIVLARKKVREAIEQKQKQKEQELAEQRAELARQREMRKAKNRSKGLEL